MNVVTHSNTTFSATLSEVVDGLQDYNPNSFWMGVCGSLQSGNLSLECPVHCKQNTLLRTILYYFYKLCSKRAGICTSLPYRNFFLFLNFIPAQIFKPCKVPTKIYILPCAHKYVPHANYSRPRAVSPTVWESLT
jgi:hypothetical protein